ncbi:MAG: hypoxanthine phosphoribosyltransferase [Planctomycetota bacterium]
MNDQEPAHPWAEGTGRVLIERAQIKQRVRELGEVLAQELMDVLEAEGEGPADHADRVVMLPVMTGAMVFTADLIRRMPVKLSMRLVTVSSYAGQTTESRGAAFRGVIPRDLGGRHVVIIDDILDTGRTLQLVRDIVREQNPASVRSCVLLDKPERREVDIRAEHVGFEIPDAFVVGYGLDYDGYYRNVPDIRVLDASP